MHYKEGYIAFIDILGFSKFVSDENNGEIVYHFFDFVKNYCYLFNDSNDLKDKWGISFFSDSIIITSTDSDIQTLFLPIYIAESFVRDKMGLLFRGGLCYGKYYHKDNIMYGPGVIAAYNLEKQANYSFVRSCCTYAVCL